MVAYSVVVPVYNSAPLIARLYGLLSTVMESLDRPFELIFVDDFSTDASWIALGEVARVDQHVIATQLGRNAGQGPATLYGLGLASGEIIITLDDDLQHAPEDIPRLLQALDGPDGCDVAFGIPIWPRHAFWRRFASWNVNFAISMILRKPLHMRFTGFRAIRRPILLRLLGMRCAEPFVSAMLYQITRRIAVVRVAHSSSQLGASRYSIAKLARVAFGCFASLSDANRRNVAIGAAACGLGLLALAGRILSIGAPGLAAEMAVVLGISFGIAALGIGSAAAAMELCVRMAAFRPPVNIVPRRLISNCHESLNEH